MNISLSCFRHLFSLVAICCLFLEGAAWSASSVSHYGITWSFSADKATGTFANGEPWVVGPVTITNISPGSGSSGNQNGSMLNPIPSSDHGFDSYPVVYSNRLLEYKPALNVARQLPLNLVPGDSLVSVKSRPEYDYYIKTVCALTVLSSPAPAGAFRPGIFGNNRSARLAEVAARNVSQINWAALKSHAPVAATPSLSTIQAQMPSLPWFEWSSNWTGYRLQAEDNTADGNKQYGRETAAKFGQVGMWLNTNQSYASKYPIAVQMVQIGIDVDNYIRNGGGFWPDGGHKHGRKLPLVMAAFMLNDAGLKETAGSQDKNLFQEDGQTWYVTQADVGRQLAPPSPGYSMLQYRQQDVGIAEWGIRHSWLPSEDNRDWNTGYRMVVGPSMMGCWLTAWMMGAQNVWAHPAAFGYMDRLWNQVGGSGWSSFTDQMYSSYRGGGTITPPPASAVNPVISPASGNFDSPTLVTISTSTPSATIRYTLNGATPGSSDLLYSGPITVTATTTIKAIAFATGMNPSGVSTGQLNFSAKPPTFSPAPGSFSSGQSVTLSTLTGGATIRYTTDGSEPGTNSPVYTGPIAVAATTTIRAITIKAGLDISPVASGVYAIGAFVGSQTWVSTGFPSQTSSFSYGFAMTPSATNIDALVGIGGINPVSAYDQLACVIRFNSSGKIDARNGGTYTSLVDLPYTAGSVYVVRLTVDPAAKTYGATVSVNGGEFVVIAQDFAFRTEQASLSTFNTMALFAYVGTHIVSDYGLLQAPPSQPQGLRVVEQ